MPDGSLAGARTVADAALFRNFESLGDNCEFGFVHHHFNPTNTSSLLRWAGTDLDRLVHGLETGFAGVGDPAQTRIIWSEREYSLHDPRFFTTHTFHQQQAPTPEREAELLRRGCAALRLLRRLLLRDIAEGRRIFVHKSASPAFDEPAMHRLHAALRRHGPAGLLCVRPPRPGEVAGTVSRLAPGLMLGRIDRFVMAEGPYDLWHSLCRQALALHHG